MMNKLSVIIPVYNVGELLRKSVDSVLSQNRIDCEVVIVDDGSTDGSAELCDSYSAHPQVMVIHKPNGGLSSARNAGIEAATGDYFLFLDSDDYLLPGSLALLADLIKAFPTADFIQYGYEEVKDYSRQSEVTPALNPMVETTKRAMFTRMLDLGGIGASACTKLISRRALGALRFTEGIIQEDEDFTPRLIEQCSEVVYIDNALYMYVWRDGSIITQKYTTKRLDIIPVLNMQSQILERNGCTDLARRVKMKLFVSLCQYYVLARQAGATTDAKIIKTEAGRLAPEVKSIGGDRFARIAALMSLHLPALQAYYYFKKLR